ncbi:MAG: YvrJ family protein [Butyrivibrio sp.]|nr:YvrJ family protein [Butyrivibrio sp.]
MDVNAITSLIGSVGFPIAMSIYLIHFMQTEQKEMRDTISELKEAIIVLTSKIKGEHKDEV